MWHSFACNWQRINWSLHFYCYLTEKCKLFAWNDLSSPILYVQCAMTFHEKELWIIYPSIHIYCRQMSTVTSIIFKRVINSQWHKNTQKSAMEFGSLCRTSYMYLYLSPGYLIQDFQLLRPQLKSHVMFVTFSDSLYYSVIYRLPSKPADPKPYLFDRHITNSVQ